jgi:hypothetical protein
MISLVLRLALVLVESFTGITNARCDKKFSGPLLNFQRSVANRSKVMTLIIEQVIS